MNIASVKPKFPSSILLQWRISQCTVARHSISTTMATPTPTHRCQPKGSTIAFHCIATVSGFLMITCVLASIKFRSHIDTHKQCVSRKKNTLPSLAELLEYLRCLFASLSIRRLCFNPRIHGIYRQLMLDDSGSQDRACGDYVQQIQSDTWFQDRACGICRLQIQDDSGRKVNRLRVESIGYFENKKAIWTYVYVWMVTYIELFEYPKLTPLDYFVG